MSLSCEKYPSRSSNQVRLLCFATQALRYKVLSSNGSPRSKHAVRCFYTLSATTLPSLTIPGILALYRLTPFQAWSYFGCRFPEPAAGLPEWIELIDVTQICRVHPIANAARLILFALNCSG